ncbi:hypothetical protein N8E89_21230 (plasmid) [Phyllobacterium sp. A18/5-2]|uniref:hypothetical protein n=1 Tax=Phyllobacterium sp. A18/5-2 TaxID=2978392 RepID=UPI0021C9318C|nr:hypothetical protein [Phyllobacterium sp. A18/5-2]UXN67055.1 hypothetical protein N8E89_21230 [Phyllobacterium sp. A18/5-2]
MTLPSEHHQMIDALAAKDIEELKRVTVMHVRHAVWDLFIDTKLNCTARAKDWNIINRITIKN